MGISIKWANNGQIKQHGVIGGTTTLQRQDHPDHCYLSPQQLPTCPWQGPDHAEVVLERWHFAHCFIYLFQVMFWNVLNLEIKLIHTDPLISVASLNWNASNDESNAALLAIVLCQVGPAKLQPGRDGEFQPNIPRSQTSNSYHYWILLGQRLQNHTKPRPVWKPWHLFLQSRHDISKWLELSEGSWAQGALDTLVHFSAQDVARKCSGSTRAELLEI